MNHQDKCEDYREKITALVMGQADADSPELRQHLEHCPNCRNFHDELKTQEQEIISSFDTVKQNLNPLEGEIRTKFNHRANQPHTKRAQPWRIWAFRAGIAAVVLLAVGLRLSPFICAIATVLATHGKGF